MNRERFTWILSFVLIAVLALQLPGSFAERDDDYAFVRTLVDIYRQVSKNYVEPVDQSKLQQAAIRGMLDELDPFTVYIPPDRQEQFDSMLEGSFKGVGIQLNQLEDGDIEVVTPIDASPAAKAGVMAGDIILSVNGMSLKGLRLEEVVDRVKGPLGSTVTLEVRHVDGTVQKLEMKREEVIVPTVKGYSRDADNSWNYWVTQDPKIAYLRITQYTEDTAEKTRQALDQLLAQGMKGLILDLRFNPGGRLEEAVKMVDMFIAQGRIVTTKGRNRPEQTQYAHQAGTLPDFPMIVLVNDHSASAAEIVAGSLMDNNRALVIGQRTYGKGSVQELIPLDDSSGELKLTVAYWYLPSGRLVHRRKGAKDWGVEPQIVIPVTQEGEKRILEQRVQDELFRRPDNGAATAPSTQPTTQPTDPQLQQAITTMVGLIVLNRERPAVTQPTANQPAAIHPTVVPPAQSSPATTQPATDRPAPSSIPAAAPTH